eukprot:3871639-Prymnesium_polylepis.1
METWNGVSGLHMRHVDPTPRHSVLRAMEWIMILCAIVFVRWRRLDGGTAATGSGKTKTRGGPPCVRDCAGPQTQMPLA